MPIIHAGSCVGVFYRDAQGGLQVHNGRLRGAHYGATFVPYVDTTVRPTAVYIAHWLYSSAQQATREEMARRITRIDSVHLTPDLPTNHPYYCANFRHIPRDSRILPGDCVGVWYRMANGTNDMKNGRYLYWIDFQGRRHCVLHPTDTPAYVIYYHWNIVDGQRVPEVTYRPPAGGRVRGVFRTTF